MLNLVVITYNDMPLLKRCIDSVEAYVDRIILVDGIFEDFPLAPGDEPLSTDGTVEYFVDLETKAEKVLIAYPGLSEVEKRNRYLLGEPGDWYLHLDADERVENPETLFDLPDADVCWCQMRWTNRFSRYPRLFRHVDGLHYDGLHYRLVDADGNLFTDIQETGLGYTRAPHPLRIQHDIDQRHVQRKKQKAIYYRRLTRREREIKEQLKYGCYTARPYQKPD